MIKSKSINLRHELIEKVVYGIQEKKGKEITCLNLGEIQSTVCDYFVVCHGTSNTHVNAIAESIEEKVNELTGLKPSRREGFANAEWILLDYLDVVVHIFQEEVRNYYKLEELWADAPVERISD